MGTIRHVAVDGRYAGHIVISDVIKPHARQAIAALKRNGIKQTVMLTGDTRRTAENIAKDVGVDQVYSELLPADKVNKVEQLLARKGEKEKLAFVGDGINDAPVLTRADTVLLWEPWALMQLLKQPTSHSWMMIPCRLPMLSFYRGNVCVLFMKISFLHWG